MRQARLCFKACAFIATLAISAAGQDLTTGLRGHWKLNETSGSIAADSSGYGSSGTVFNGTAWTSTCGGTRVFNFNGTDHYIKVNNASHLQPTTALTIAAWIKGDAWGTGTDVDVILRKGEDNPNNYQLAISGGRVELLLDGNDGSGFRGNTVLSTGVWYHVVATWDGSTVRLYVNGQLNNTPATKNAPIGTDNRPVYLGGRSGTDYFDGMIYDVRLYNRALSSSDVKLLYGYIGHWKLNATSGTTAADSSPVDKNGAVIGGATWTTRCNGTGAINFNGSSQYISISSSCNVQPTTALTIAAWIQGYSWGTGDDVDAILRKGEGNPNNYQLAIADGRVGLYLDEWDNAGTRGDTVLSTGRWYHVAATWDGSTVRIYVDGELNNTPTSRTGTIGIDTRPLYIGGRSGADFFDGEIQDVRLYRYALSASEIAQLAGFVAHWKLNQTTGTTATDSSPVANNGTYMNGVGLNDSGPYPGEGAVAAKFDGVNDYVAVANESIYDFTDHVAIAGWFKVNAFNSSYQTIIAKGDTAWRLSRWGLTNKLHFACNGLSPNQVNGSVDVNDDNWHHVVCMYDGSALSMYLDGVLDASANSSGSINTNGYAVQVAANEEKPGRNFNGWLQGMRLYGRALCPAEIAELYGLVGHWKLDEASGTTAADASLCANPANLTGTASWTTGSVDGAHEFNYTNGDDYFTIPNSSSLENVSEGSYSLSGWFKPNSVPAGTGYDNTAHYALVAKPDYPTGLAYSYERRFVFLHFVTTSSYYVATSPSTYNAGVFHHLAGVVDVSNGTVKLYVDGQLVSTANFTPGTTGLDYGTQPWRIGISTPGASMLRWAAHGLADDVRVYNRALRPTEIQSLYDSGSGAVGGVRIIKWVEIQ